MAAALAASAVAVAGCGGSVTLGSNPVVGLKSKTPKAAQKLGFPTVATKNTTRVGGGDPIVDAAAVALAVYPSAAPGTHPQMVVLAPQDNWQAAIAADSLMAPPFRAPLLLSDSKAVPSATQDAITTLAPTGYKIPPSKTATQAISVGSDAKAPAGLTTQALPGTDGIALAAAIDKLETSARGHPSKTVLIVSADDPAYAMPAAGYAAESGEPILYVTSTGVPQATKAALLQHQGPRIYVLGPRSVIPDAVLKELAKLGTVKRVGAEGDAANSVAFTIYRDPICTSDQACAHVPGSFGWAMRSPGHGYVLVNAGRPLDAAAAGALSSSGSYGPMLLVDDSNSLPQSVLNYFLDYATPGYSQTGPTAAVYNHGWVIGDSSAVSVSVQAQLDSLLEVVPQGK